MEIDKDFKELQNLLNEKTNEQSNDIRYMKTLMMSNSKNEIAKTNSYELLNLVTAGIAALYFITRTVIYSDYKFLFWTGVISSVLWIGQFMYSLVGYRKIESINLGEDSMLSSIEKIVGLRSHYSSQIKYYIWLAPVTMFAALPIPLYEFRGIDFTSITFTPQTILYLVLVYVITIVAVIWLSKNLWKTKFNNPLVAAKNNLEELLG